MMGLFDKLISKLTGVPPSAETQAKPTEEARVTGRTAGGLSFTVTGPAVPTVHVADAEVTQRALEHEHVLSNERASLKTADQWWNEDTHKRRRRENSDKAYAWLLPFVPLDVAKMEELQAAQDWGPHGAGTLAKRLRVLIRERRKSKEPHHLLLRALYGACIAEDLAKSLAFEGTQPHYMAQFVDLNELQSVELDYALMGYQCTEALSKTDVKWLVEAFGEPAEHQSFNALWPHVQRNAIARYCWGELRRSNESSKYLGQPQKTMREWVHELVKRNIGYHKDWQERVAARQAYLSELGAMLEAAWSATHLPFIVADLETTGLNAETDEVLEFGAVKAGAPRLDGCHCDRGGPLGSPEGGHRSSARGAGPARS